MLRRVKAAVLSALRISRSSERYYETLYQRADLQNDYWTIVGSATREQFEYFGRVKLAQLVTLVWVRGHACWIWAAEPAS
jgi:hypothetical protein